MSISWSEHPQSLKKKKKQRNGNEIVDLWFFNVMNFQVFLFLFDSLNPVIQFHPYSIKAGGSLFPGSCWV